MKNREDKKKDFEDLRKALESVHNVFVTGYEKITVDQDYNLRKTVRGAGGSYKVIKNNVAEKASVSLPSEAVLQGLKGMTLEQQHAADEAARRLRDQAGRGRNARQKCLEIQDVPLVKSHCKDAVSHRER